MKSRARIIAEVRTAELITSDCILTELIGDAGLVHHETRTHREELAELLSNQSSQVRCFVCRNALELSPRYLAVVAFSGKPMWLRSNSRLLTMVALLIMSCPSLVLRADAQQSPKEEPQKEAKLKEYKPPFKEGWVEVHSGHFGVITDAGEKRGREVALRLEQMQAVFADLLKRNKLNYPIPVEVVALKSDKDYQRLSPIRNGQAISAPGFFL